MDFIIITNGNNTRRYYFIRRRGRSIPFFIAERNLKMKRNEIMKLTLSAMFLALAFVMPFLTGQIPQIGSMLCPMHIPVL